MTIVQLEYVLSVAKYLNFTLAAEKSFVTQPTLSMQIQKLERELEIDIFDRSTHPIKITPIGEKVIEQAKVIIAESKRMRHLVDEEKEVLTGRFVVGVIPTVLPFLVPMFYKTFRKNNPKIELIIKELKTEEIINELYANNIDFGITVTPLMDEKIIEKKMYYEPIVAYIPEHHKDANLTKLKVEELDSANMLLLEEGHCFRNNALSLCDPSQLKGRDLALESGNFNTLVKLADDGFGITLLPSLFAEELSPQRQKNVKVFKEPIPTREISLIYHHTQLRNRFAEEIVKVIHGVLRGKLFIQNSGKLTFPTVKIPK